MGNAADIIQQEAPMKDYIVSGYDATNCIIGELRVTYGRRNNLTRRKAKKRLKGYGAVKFSISSAAA